MERVCPVDEADKTTIVLYTRIIVRAISLAAAVMPFMVDLTSLLSVYLQ